MMVRKQLKPEHRGKNSTTFTGNPQGAQVREELCLDECDEKGEDVEILIPKDTTSFNPSFYLGLLYKSIVFYHGIEAFKKKYHFTFEDTDEELISLLKENIEDNERQAQNEYFRFRK